MKELSIEQKAKAYDEALERVWELLSRCKNNRDRRTMVYRVEDIESIFPELKKSEDEKIKEDLIQWISDFPDMIWSGHYREDVIKWLERQDKKETENKFEPKFNVGDEIKTGNKESLTITKIDEKGYWSEDLFICSFEDSAKWELVGKPVDMIKPKFKVGDWISNDMCDVHIASIEDGMYYFDEGDGLSIVFVDEHYHIWTIEDAIDGDVLVNGSNIFIFHFINGTRLMGYCHVNTDNGRFYDDIGKNECFCLIDAVINPATKEQRDTLFAKMKEAGYIWIFSKKELIKVEQNPTKWSEEDERNIQNIDSVLFYDKKLPEDTCVKLRNFLKTLKQRCI